MKSFATLCIFLLALSSPLVSGTTGKISGTAKDAQTGEPLVGVNIVITGTTLGASTNVDGAFVILNVSPGDYAVRASSLGYASITQTSVRVEIDQTTELKFSLKQQVVQGEEVVIVAQRPIVQKDVSASTTNLSVKEFENLPAVQNISSVMSLQAGIQVNQVTGDLVIRGGGGDQTAFMLNGNTLRDERNNTSYLGISLSSIQDVQIQTGGFNAEYGNVRSGIVNVTTKEGSTEAYSANVIARYSPAHQKHYGPSPNDKNSYWIRPYVDPSVAFIGTGKDFEAGSWDKYTRDQFPYFEGWNSVSKKTLLDNDPNNDLTPEAAQQLFLWQHRKVVDIQDPDYDVDASFGGPFPFVGKELGNLRFFASYRTATSQYLVPLSKNAYQDYNGQIKITSDITGGMKLTVEGLTGQSTGTNDNNSGLAGVFNSPSSIANQLNKVSYIDARIFATDYWAPTTITRNMIGAKLSHAISAETFYEVSTNLFATDYSTNPGRTRDMNKVYVFGNADSVDEAPFGFQPNPSTGIDGLRMGVGFSNSRDSSKVSVYSTRADITSQVDRYNQLKGGLEFIYVDNNVNYASVDVYLPSGRSQSVWHTYPVRAAGYVQDKFEFEGMIANIGLRLDYSHAGGYWYSFDPYTRAFTGDKSLGLDTLLTHESTKKIVNLSPRLGVSFPVTENSKLYFNYGHFRSMPTPENLFLIRRYSDNNQVTRIANPNNPLPKTVAYELGYEQNLFDQFLLHLSGYYKNVSDQPVLTSYLSKDGKVSYSISTSKSYEDIRGFEATFSKTRGDWVTGFLNYTYELRTTGRFGFASFFESSQLTRDYQNNITNIQNDLYQDKPTPKPYGRANIDFTTPEENSPEVLGFRPLSDFRVSLLANYQG
ncbi:MAG: TonB-dependent receptor, partial [Bacteroidota bacterium]